MLKYKAKLKKAFNNWLFKEAKWYEIWLPQSEPFGGAVLGTIVGLVFCLSIFGVPAL